MNIAEIEDQLKQVPTQRINADFDFESHSLFDAAILLEKEHYQQSEEETRSALFLQKIVLKSKLSEFKVANQSKLSALLDHLYQEQGYRGDWQAFYKIENALISKVLTKRKGIPITMGIVLLAFLEASDFEAFGICFTSGFIVQVNCEKKIIYIDPFTGEIQSWAQLEVKARGYLGNHTKLTLDMLTIDSHKIIIKRLLNVMKAAYIQAENMAFALLCSDILLRIDPEDVYEIRDRGFLFQHLNCVNLAVQDFEFFIKKQPKDPIVDVLKKQITAMRLNEPVLH